MKYPNDIYDMNGKKFWLDYDGPLNDEMFNRKSYSDYAMPENNSALEDYQHINNMMI